MDPQFIVNEVGRDASGGFVPDVRAPAVVPSVSGLIGRTPLLRLRHIPQRSGAEVWVKAEHLNPGGSVKDRVALAMIDAGIKRGALQPGGLIVEPTSGNTGVSLALLAAERGFRLILTMPESMSLERRALLEAYGAEVVLTPEEEVMRGAVAAARRIAAEQGGFLPDQFSNPANPAAHEHGTGPELIGAFPGDTLAAFVAAVGTGGTVTGVGRALRAAGKHVRVVAIEPETSAVLSGGCSGPTKLQGIGAGFVPQNFDRDVVDEVRLVDDRSAHAMKRRLAEEEGLLVGLTAAANVAVACELAAELPADRAVATILCDTGERYFSLDTYFEIRASCRPPASNAPASATC